MVMLAVVGQPRNHTFHFGRFALGSNSHASMLLPLEFIHQDFWSLWIAMMGAIYLWERCGDLCRPNLRPMNKAHSQAKRKSTKNS
mmetsp:Transcript_6761/g.12532  ORF Transcript_6761/g.12532 Transcript_6761/m.12532 type:complete len:85 (-) Transcript_6761:31-285(-)